MTAHGFKRCKRRILAARNHDLFFGADDEVAIGEDRLQMGGHIARFDIALFTRAMACEAPKVRAVININGNLAAMFLGVLHRELLSGGRIGFGEMRAGDNYRARGGNEGLIDIAFIQCVIGAIITVENQRELLVVANA